MISISPESQIQLIEYAILKWKDLNFSAEEYQRKEAKKDFKRVMKLMEELCPRSTLLAANNIMEILEATKQ